MHPRYEVYDVQQLWSPMSIYAQWLAIEKAVLFHQRDLGTVPKEGTADFLGYLGSTVIEPYDLTAMSIIERGTKHDVVAFLQWVRGGWPSEGAAYLHFGLTSSDVVDTAQGMRFRDMRRIYLHEAQELVNRLTSWATDRTPVLGRTHGQAAEPMELRARAMHWASTLGTAVADLSRMTNRVAVCKLSGPVGTYAHNGPELEKRVAMDLNLRPHGMGASQIANRAPLAAWANSAAVLVGACGKIAMDLRLMNLLGEARSMSTVGQVGSSSMPHKNNPILAEQITGMQRLARGYASMLQPLDDWLERDIAHSSVERVAVPDLWHVVMHTIKSTSRLLDETDIDVHQMGQNIELAGNEPLSAEVALSAIDVGRSWDEARRIALTSETGALPEDAERFMINYPEWGVPQ